MTKPNKTQRELIRKLALENGFKLKGDDLHEYVYEFGQALIDAVTQPWQPPETAPKDQVFIGNFGLPWPLVAQWSGVDGKFVIAQAAVGMFEGVYNDTYFENEWLPVNELQAWMPMPGLSDDVVQPSSGPKTLTHQQKQKILDHVNKIITDGGAVYHRTIIDLTEWALLSENGFTELTWAEWVRQDRHQ